MSMGSAAPESNGRYGQVAESVLYDVMLFGVVWLQAEYTVYSAGGKIVLEFICCSENNILDF